MAEGREPMAGCDVMVGREVGVLHKILGVAGEWQESGESLGRAPRRGCHRTLLLVVGMALLI